MTITQKLTNPQKKRNAAGIGCIGMLPAGLVSGPPSRFSTTGEARSQIPHIASVDVQRI
jgi:hypothetical protein